MKNWQLNIVMAIVVWVVFSMMTSAAKNDLDNCDKTYPIDYVLYTNMFCEIEE